MSTTSGISPPSDAGRPAAGALHDLLRRRMIFVAGKGGTGKTSIAAALALVAARRGQRVLAIEVDAKGDLPRALGRAPVGFQPAVVQHNLSVLAMHPEESFQEYLRVFFKIPRLARYTPLSKVFDFIATGVPGPRDMLVIGKIAYEERRRESGQRIWDLIVVDCAASGHVLPQLTAARSMRQLVRGGIIAGQVDWVDQAVCDPRRSALCLTALPEEMPVVEALELHDGALRAGLPLGPAFLNRSLHLGLSANQKRLLTGLTTRGRADTVSSNLGGRIDVVREGVELGDELTSAAKPMAERFAAGMSVPVVDVPLLAARPGMAMTREIATTLRGQLS
ncbi:MAG: ArsA-related P-loop ATPase [Candidatus Dormibacteria bacterium]